MNFDEKERILKSVLEQIEPERTARKKAQMKKLSTVAAALIVVVVMGACAVKVFQLDDKIAAVIGGSSPQIENTAVELDAADESNGIRIEGKQLISDGSVTYIAFDVISLTNQKFSYQYTFRDSYVRIDDMYLAFGRIYSVSAVSDDEKTMSLVMEVKADLVGEHHVEMFLETLEDSSTEEIIQQGKWKLEFDAVFESLIKSFDINQTIVVDGITLSIDKADISPLTFYLSVSIPEGSEMPPEEWWGIDTFSKVEILFKDGSTALVTDRGAGWTDEGDKQWGEIEGRPTDFIDVNDIVGLSFDGQQVELE